MIFANVQDYNERKSSRKHDFIVAVSSFLPTFLAL